MRLFEADAHHALIGMMTTLPKVLLGLLKTLLLGSTIWTLFTTASSRCSSRELCQQGIYELPNLCEDPNG